MTIFIVSTKKIVFQHASSIIKQRYILISLLPLPTCLAIISCKFVNNLLLFYYIIDTLSPYYIYVPLDAKSTKTWTPFNLFFFSYSSWSWNVKIQACMSCHDHLRFLLFWLIKLVLLYFFFSLYSCSFHFSYFISEDIDEKLIDNLVLLIVRYHKCFNIKGIN